MASEGTTSRLPSGLMARNSSKANSESSSSTAYSYSDNGGESPWSNLPLILSVIALLLAAGSFYISFTSPHGLTSDDRAQLSAISADLRSIQQKVITLSSPLKTTVSVDESFPASDIFPSNFALPLDIVIPINTTITAQSNTGEVVPLHIDDTISVRDSIPIDVNKTLSGVPITISKDIPIDTQFSVNLQVSAVYGKELNDLIGRLDNMSQEGSTTSGTSGGQ